MELDLYNIDGTLSGEKVTLPDAVFNIEPNDHAIYLAVKVRQTNMRQGTAASRNRRLIRGGGKKPWKQKGRGTARSGSSRSSVWVGGARTFGPQPRAYHMKITKKVKSLARRSALTYKALNHEIKVVKDFELENPKTKEMFAILKNLELNSQKVLFMVPNAVAKAENKIMRAGRNIPNLEIRVAVDASTFDILNCKTLLVQQSSIQRLEATL
jgi:large subunit ribosomal protein L4